MRRCVGMGGGALLGDFVGGGAGAASFAMRAAMAEALPDDLGVFAAAFSFLAASSLAFALAIISATPILFRLARCRRAVLSAPLFCGRECRGADGAARQNRQHWASPRTTRVARGWLWAPQKALWPRLARAASVSRHTRRSQSL